MAETGASVLKADLHSRWHGRIARACRLLPLWLALGMPQPGRAAEEEELKAAIVYNLLMFVEWPADAQPPLSGTLVLCLQPESRYAEALNVLAARPLRGLHVTLREAPPADVATSCNALLLEDKAAASAPLARRLQSKSASVLVISDGADIASEGVVISLQRNDRKVSFDLNLASARRARLQLSSKLMRLAHGVIE